MVQRREGKRMGERVERREKEREREREREREFFFFFLSFGDEWCSLDVAACNISFLKFSGNLKRLMRESF